MAHPAACQHSAALACRHVSVDVGAVKWLLTRCSGAVLHGCLECACSARLQTSAIPVFEARALSLLETFEAS